MKLASVRTGGRDGALVVVSDDLTSAVAVPDTAPTLAAVPEDWAAAEPRRIEVAGQLEHGDHPGARDLDLATPASPLPRSHQFLDGSVGPRDGAGVAVHDHFFGQSSFAGYGFAHPASLVVVDGEVPSEVLAPLGRGVVTGCGAVWNTLRVQPGAVVAVFGAGTVGLSAVMAARVAGAARVIAVGLHPNRLDLARALGATDAVVASTSAATAAAVLECSGSMRSSCSRPSCSTSIRQSSPSLHRRRPDPRISPGHRLIAAGRPTGGPSMEPWSACAPLCSVRPAVVELLGRLLAEPVTWLRALPGWLVLATAGTVIAAETSLLVGMVLPGASAVLALGLLAHQGTVSALPAAVTAAAAAVMGAHVGYWVGRRRGLPTGSALRRPTLRAVGLFRRLGPAAVCLGQWTVGVRTLTPRLAGCSGMPYHRFARYSAPTAATWGATLVLLGTLSGDYSAPLLHWLGYGPAGVLALLLALGWWRYRRLGRLPGRRRRGVPTAP